MSEFKLQLREDRPATIEEHRALRDALRRMTQAFRPFTLKPMGGEGSIARAEQEEQIAAHAEAMKLLK